MLLSEIKRNIPKTKKDLVILLAATSMAISLAWCLIWLISPSNKTFQEIDAVSLTPDVILGNPNSKVKIVEYSSLSCSHCADFHKNIFPSLSREYIDTGKISYEYRNFPLNSVALKASVAVRCLPLENRSDAIAKLYETQTSWAFPGNSIIQSYESLIKPYISNDNFQQCISSGVIENEILNQILHGKKAGVVNTPTIFINGEIFKGQKSFESISTFLDDRLKEIR